MMDVYKEIPVFTSPAYRLRGVALSDAEALLNVYGDPEAVPYFNGDNCHGDTFYYPTLARMEQAVAFWLDSYRQRYFVRWSVEDRATNEVIGTIELFDRPTEDGTGVCALLRLDLRRDRETAPVIQAVLDTLYPAVLPYFAGRTVVTKCWPYASQRRRALEALGFAPSERLLVGEGGVQYGDYWTKVYPE